MIIRDDITNKKQLANALLLACATSVLLLLLSLSAFLSHSQPSEEQIERELYCEMLQLYKDTGGQYGWPPYKGEC